ncbi:MAG TPA: sporulation protein [Clostridiales bacterium]|nr:sporulation protein [Clostridiales bacterium]
MAKKLKSTHNKYKSNVNKTLYKEFDKHIKNKDKDKSQYLETLSNKINIPSNIIAGAPIIYSVGRNEICIENYKGIIEYNQVLIKIQSKYFKIHIHGKRLKIVYFNDEEIYITGFIQNINYTS